MAHANLPCTSLATAIPAHNHNQPIIWVAHGGMPQHLGGTVNATHIPAIPWPQHIAGSYNVKRTTPTAMSSAHNFIHHGPVRGAETMPSCRTKKNLRAVGSPGKVR